MSTRPHRPSPIDAGRGLGKQSGAPQQRPAACLVIDLRGAASSLDAAVTAIGDELRRGTEEPTVGVVDRAQVLVGEVGVAVRLVRRLVSEIIPETVAGRRKCRDGMKCLSDRECEVVRMLADGATISEIARRHRVSVKTVSTYRTRALRKLRLQSTADLVRYGIGRRPIDQF